jgi:hypothetical protein
MDPITDAPTALPFDYDLLSSKTVVAARATLLEMEQPVVPLTQYRDCGDGTFVVMSDTLRRILRPISHDRDYLILAQFDGILFKVSHLREYLTLIPTGTQLRCRFTDYKYTLQGEQWTTDGRQWESITNRFGLLMEYTLDGVKSRSFFACIDMRFFKPNKKNVLFRFEMYLDIPGHPRWMTAYDEDSHIEHRLVAVTKPAPPAEPKIALTHLERQIVDYLDAHPKSEALTILDGIKGKHEIDMFYTSLFRLVNVGALVSDTVLADRVYEISNYYHSQLTSQ